MVCESHFGVNTFKNMLSLCKNKKEFKSFALWGDRSQEIGSVCKRKIEVVAKG